MHETVAKPCLGRDFYFFMDGDATSLPKAFTAMVTALTATPYAHAAAAVPLSAAMPTTTVAPCCVSTPWWSTLCALRSASVERLVQERVRVPLKLEGDDGMIGAFVKRDLKPTTNGTVEKRIVVYLDAGFRFESFTHTRLGDWKVHWKRAVRYGRCSYELRLLGPPFVREGMKAMPADMTDVYPQADNLTLRWQGAYPITNWVALRQMRGGSGATAMKAAVSPCRQRTSACPDGSPRTRAAA